MTNFTKQQFLEFAACGLRIAQDIAKANGCNITIIELWSAQAVKAGAK